MSIGFLFPGQGTHRVGMGVAVCQAHPAARARFEAASDQLGYDLGALCRSGPEAVLRGTEHAQPAIYVTGVTHLEWLLERGIAPAAVAGHSVGELAALVAAGVLTFAEGLRLVAARGRLMATAPVGEMTAIRGLAEAEVTTVLAEAAAGPGAVAVIAVVNGPEDLVVAGTAAAMAAVRERVRHRRPARARSLAVGGAFHSPLMAPVLADWKAVVADATIGHAKLPIALNATGTLVSDPAAIRHAMVRHLVDPVRWSASLDALRAVGVDEVVECGDGRSLRVAAGEAGVRVRSARPSGVDGDVRPAQVARRD